MMTKGKIAFVISLNILISGTAFADQIVSAQQSCMAERQNLKNVVERASAPGTCKQKLVQAALCCAGYDGRSDCRLDLGIIRSQTGMNGAAFQQASAAGFVHSGLERNLNICGREINQASSADCAQPSADETKQEFLRATKLLATCLNEEMENMRSVVQQSTRALDTVIDAPSDIAPEFRGGVNLIGAANE